MLISGCQDNEISWDGSAIGLLTRILRHVWDDGAFTGDNGAFHRSIKQHLVSRQSPNICRVGGVTSAFRRQKLFSV